MERLEQRYLNQYKDAEVEQKEANPDLYCVACNKEFKSSNAFQNHEASKKHKQNVDMVKKTMTDEEKNFQKAQNMGTCDSDDKEGEISESDQEVDVGELSENEESDEVALESNKKVKKYKKKTKVVKVDESESSETGGVSDQEKPSSPENLDWGPSKKVKPKKIKSQNPNPQASTDLSNKPTKKEESDDSDESQVASKKSNKKRLGRASGYGRGHYMAEAH